MKFIWWCRFKMTTFRLTLCSHSAIGHNNFCDYPLVSTHSWKPWHPNYVILELLLCIGKCLFWPNNVYCVSVNGKYSFRHCYMGMELFKNFDKNHLGNTMLWHLLLVDAIMHMWWRKCYAYWIEHVSFGLLYVMFTFPTRIYLQGSSRLCNWLSLWRLVPWINHLPPCMLVHFL